MYGFRVFDNKEKRYLDGSPKDFLKLWLINISCMGDANYLIEDSGAEFPVCAVSLEILWPGRFKVEYATGIKDKNGKMIYKNDIVEVTILLNHDYFSIDEGLDLDIAQANAVMKFNENTRTFILETPQDFSEDYFIEYNDPEQFLVVGNINQNPELLEQ